MQYGFVMPSGDARFAADLARECEQVGWDGFFVWEPVWGIDAWVCLTAAAMVTGRIRLGTMLTPLSRMRPWKLASESATLDHLSGGRVIVAAGLGAPEVGFENFGEVIDRKQRAELLDEGLDLLALLHKAEPFDYEGKHYKVNNRIINPPPPSLHRPHIPIWVVGARGSERSMRRVAKYDGLIPTARDAGGDWRQANADELREMVAGLRDRRETDAPFDVIVEGETPPGDEAANRVVAPYRDAGATWYIEAQWMAESPAAVLERAKAGPPRVD